MQPYDKVLDTGRAYLKAKAAVDEHWLEWRYKVRPLPVMTEGDRLELTAYEALQQHEAALRSVLDT